MDEHVADQQGTVPDPPVKRNPGRILLDSVSETIINSLFFVLRFLAWGIRWSVALVIFLAVMALAGYIVFTQALSGGEYVTVPNIIDMPITEAAFQVAEQGLELGTQKQVTHQTVPKYHVITQRPEAGRVVRAGRKVYPTVSMGAHFQKTPDVTFKSMDEARRIIEQSPFRLGTVARIPNKRGRDTVLAQDPPAGEKLPNQGDIHLLVSDGMAKDGSFMPDIQGMDVQDLLLELAAYGVILIPNIVDYPGAAEDIVLRQEPPPNDLVHAGQVVMYDVKPSGRVPLPDARQQAVVRHTMNFDYFDRDVRVDVVDRFGNRSSIPVKPPLFTEEAKRTYVAGSVLKIPVEYLGEATVEVYINGERMESYFVSQGNDPIPASARSN